MTIQKRPRYEMPTFMHDALTARGLMNVYRVRPPY
jgi:hypothetical protein